MTTERDLIQRLADDLEGITEELVIPEYAHTEKERTDASLALVAEARALLSQPEPEGPTDEEILNLSQEHQVPYAMCDGGVIYPLQAGADMKDDVLSFARALIAADRARWGRPAIKPVPVSERLPGKGDCDSEGRCWLTSVDVEPGWVTDNPEQCTNWTHWLPHYALPVPTTTT